MREIDKKEDLEKGRTELTTIDGRLRHPPGHPETLLPLLTPKYYSLVIQQKLIHHFVNCAYQ